MSQLFSVTSGLTAGAAAGSIKVAIALAAGSTINGVLVGADITFDGVNAAAVPVKVEWVSTTAAPSGGSTYTPNQIGAERASIITARVNDTTDGTSPTILAAWEIPPTSGVIQQLPLGREWKIPVSSFRELRVTWLSGQTVVNYLANLYFEE